MKFRSYIEIVSNFFVFLFVYAAAMKLLDVKKFQVQIGQSPLLAEVAGLASWSVPLLELAIAAMLCVTSLRPIGLYAAFFLMVIFTTYIIVILNFSEHVPCSCGGVLESLGWAEHLAFNGFCLLLGFTAILALKRRDKGMVQQPNNIIERMR